MHPKFLNVLCCPRTYQTLHLESELVDSLGMVITGKLLTNDGISYPIIRGIPRFVDAEYYASSFGFEWNRWPKVQFESENIGKPMAGHTSSMWKRITNATPEQVKEKLIVEFGCGSGRFLDVIRQQGGTAIGIDLSQAVEAARRNFANDPNVLIVQGDITNPPFRESAFDGGYTIGVLHHTPKPLEGLKALTKTIKSDGWAACCVYPKGEFYDYVSVKRFRRIHNFLKPTFQYYPALIYIYLSAYILTPIISQGSRIPVLSILFNYLAKNWIVILNLPDVRWRILDIFDAITPSIATTHDSDEVFQWMEASNCKDIHQTDWCNTSFAAIKK